MFHLLERWLVYPAPPLGPADWHPADLPYEDVTFTGDDGTRLHGWYVAHAAPRATVLYCHGNGEHVAHLTDWLRVLHELIGVTVLAWDYRGYGRSEGVPHEENLIADARAAQLSLADRAGVPPKEVVLMGRSLGGSVAVAVAAQYPIRALVLDRTYARLTDTAARFFPWLPVRWFMRNRFPSLERIANYHGPLLQTHGSDDEIVPIEMGRQLFDAAASRQKQFITVPGGTHNEPLPEFCYQALIEFIDELKPDD